MPARLAASAIFSHEPFTTLISFFHRPNAGDLGGDALGALALSGVRGRSPQRHLAVGGRDVDGRGLDLASPSSALFTRAASSLFGSGFGASGAFASGAGAGVMGEHRLRSRCRRRLGRRLVAAGCGAEEQNGCNEFFIVVLQ